MKRASPVALLAALVASAGPIIGCNGILGIEEATLEPDGSVVANDAGDAGDGGGRPIVATDPPTCDNYCAIMMQNCSGPNLEYLSNDVCMTLCGYMAKGQFYDPGSEPDNVDTLGCRLWHATFAAAHPETHCRHAGPLGADLCGGVCEPFCSLDWHYCTDDNTIPVYDGQVTGCENACSGDGGAPYSYVEGDSGDLVDPTGSMIETGNTLNCRLWHLETAIDEKMPMTHCPHTGQQSATCM